MLNTAYRILKHEENARDIVQDSFVEAFTRIHTLRNSEMFGIWLKKIVVNKALNLLKSSKLIYSDSEEIIPEMVENPLTSEESWKENLLQVEKIKKALLSLPDGFRIVFSLFALEGYTHKEIASILGISESTSRTQYMRAREKLLKHLKEITDEN